MLKRKKNQGPTEAAVTVEPLQEEPEQEGPQPQRITDFVKGDKVQHISYPPGAYSEVVEVQDEQVMMWAYGLEETPIQFAINEGNGGLGNEWLPYEQ